MELPEHSIAVRQKENGEGARDGIECRFREREMVSIHDLRSRIEHPTLLNLGIGGMNHLFCQINAENGTGGTDRLRRRKKHRAPGGHVEYTHTWRQAGLLDESLTEIAKIARSDLPIGRSCSVENASHHQFGPFWGRLLHGTSLFCERNSARTLAREEVLLFSRHLLINSNARILSREVYQIVSMRSRSGGVLGHLLFEKHDSF